MTIWVSRVELSEARRHLLNLDDRTYSSGDWLARFVPGADICTAAKIASFRFLNVMSWRSKNYQSALRLPEFAGQPA